MTGTEWAAMMTAAGAFIGAVILAVRGVTGDRFQRKVTESAALLSGYTEQVKNLRGELEAARVAHDAEVRRIQERHQREIDHLNAQHTQVETRWDEERQRLEDRIETLEAQVAALLLGRA